MSGKPIRGIKWKGYPAIVIVIITSLILGSTLFFFSRFSVEVTTEPGTLEPLSPPTPTLPEADNTTIPQSTPRVAASPTVSPTPTTVLPATSDSIPATSASTSTVRQGVLRISNPTDYPVRIALLAKQPSDGKTKSTYDSPAHWDFAPQEGSSKGLLVSLPDRTVKIQPGDVLVAFAQDGSRRYWGPYVVGETPTPIWNPKAMEWHLQVEP